MILLRRNKQLPW